MKFSKKKKAKIREPKQKQIRYLYNQLSSHKNVGFWTKLHGYEEERVLTLISKFEHNGHFYLLCKNEILRKANIYEVSYDHITYIRELTDNQVRKKIKLFRTWLKKVNCIERKKYIKYVLRDTGKIDMRSTIDYLLKIS